MPNNMPVKLLSSLSNDDMRAILAAKDDIIITGKINSYTLHHRQQVIKWVT